MINFINISNDEPYQRFISYYNLAKKNQQNIIEAISINSFSKTSNEVNSRYVNLKYIKENEWIFFSNYDSPKSKEFMQHDQICATFFWDPLIRSLMMISLLSISSLPNIKAYLALILFASRS